MVGEATRPMTGVSVRWEVEVTVGEAVEGGAVGGGSASGSDDCRMRATANPTTMMTKNSRSMKGNFFPLGGLLSKLNHSSIKREQDLSFWCRRHDGVSLAPIRSSGRGLRQRSRTLLNVKTPVEACGYLIKKSF